MIPHYRPRKSRLSCPAIVIACLTLFMVTPASSVKSVEADLNLLRTPSSPGFLLLDIESSTVPRPQTVTDLTVSLRQETSEFSELPRDFAMEFSPYWVVGGEGADFNEMASGKTTCKSIWQSVQFSIATKSRTDTLMSTTDSMTTFQSTAIGAGFNASILRGRRTEEAVQAVDTHKDALRVLEGVMSDDLARSKATDPGYQELVTDIALLAAEQETSDNPDSIANLISAHQNSLEKREAALKNLISANYADQLQALREQINNLPAGRIGWQLDLAGGLVYDLPGREFDNADFKTAGGWLTGGYGWNGGIALLTARLMADENPGNQTAFDIGAGIVGDFSSKLSGSLEGAYRHVNYYNSENKDTWRLALRADYLVGKNKSLAVTFGRDFEGKTTGNLISLVQLVLGFGSTRSI